MIGKQHFDSVCVQSFEYFNVGNSGSEYSDSKLLIPQLRYQVAIAKSNHGQYKRGI